MVSSQFAYPLIIWANCLPDIVADHEPKTVPISVVIPGLFVRLMSKVDEILQPKNLSYFNVATLAYAAGLSACFVANEVFHNGQPALLYLDPSLVGSALACAAVNGQVPEVWEFKEEEEEEK